MSRERADHFGRAVRTERQRQWLTIAWHVDVDLFLAIRVPALQGCTKPTHVLQLAVYQHDMLRFDLINEARVLRIVDMGRERDVVDRHATRDALPVQCDNVVRVAQNVACHGAFHRITAHNHAIALIRRPALQQLTRYPALHKPRTRHHHTRALVVELVQAAQVAHMLEHERIVSPVETRANVLVHRMDIRLVDRHALARERRRIVDRNRMELRVRFPVLVEKQQQLLRAAQHKHGQQHTSTAPDDTVNQRREAHLFVEPRLQTLCSVGAFTDQDIRPHRRHFCLHKMPVLLTAVVTRIQYTQSCHIDHKHARTQHMPRMVRRKPQTAAQNHLLVVVHRLDLPPGR